MKNLFLLLLGATMMFVSCSEEAMQPEEKITDELNLTQAGQKVVSEINVNGNSVTFIYKDGHVGILEKYRPGDSPVLGAEFEGMTFSEIHLKLAPAKAVPAELDQIDERFEIKSEEVAGYQNEQITAGDFLYLEPKQGAMEEGLNDIWFRDNYCNPSSFYNGYKACLLNRYGPGTDWAWANCSRSRVYVYPFQGGQVHLQGKVNGSVLFDADLLSGWVYTYYMYSGKNFWGCRTNKQHYYSITNTYGDGWHWSLRSNTDC